MNNFTSTYRGFTLVALAEKKFRVFGRLICILLSCCISFDALCTTHFISGIITDTDKKPIQGASIILESTKIPDMRFTTYSGEHGDYRLDSISKGSYYMSISHDDYFKKAGDFTVDSDIEGFDVAMQPDPAAIKAKELEEVEVIAKALQTYADRDEMYLSSYNRNFGTNALDAISSLPRFIPKINSSVLQNNEMQEVSILIDGRKASADDLRNLDGNDIAKVIYYQDAPVKYRGLYGGAVANIILKRPKELKFTGKINASSALTWANTQDGAGISVLTPKSLLNANYNFRYSHDRGLRTSERYDYGDLVNSFNTIESGNESKKNSAAVSYQFETGRNLFYANFNYSGYDTHLSDEYRLIEQQPGHKGVEGTRRTSRHTFNDTFSLNLYYSHQFDGGKELMADLVGTISKSQDGGNLSQTVADGSAYDSYDTDDLTAGNIKSLISNIAFSSPLWGGLFSTNLYYQYRHLKQNYSNSYFPGLPALNESSNQLSMLGLGYVRGIGKVSFSADFTLIDNYLSMASAGSHNQLMFKPLINASYSPANFVTLQFGGWINNTVHGIGKQNTNRTLIDTRYFHENIPYMKSGEDYNLSLSATFTLLGSKLLIVPNIGYIFRHNSYIECIYSEGDSFISRPTLLPSRNDLNYQLYAICMPLPGLQLRAYLIGTYSAFDTPESSVRFNSTMFRFIANYAVNRFQFGIMLNTPQNSINGLTRLHNSWNTDISAYWNLPNFYVGLEYHYDKSSWSNLTAGSFSDHTSVIRSRTGNTISIALGINFKAGKFNRTNRPKKLANIETENGL